LLLQDSLLRGAAEQVIALKRETATFLKTQLLNP
jgi:hypothetical protein